MLFSALFSRASGGEKREGGKDPSVKRETFYLEHEKTILKLESNKHLFKSKVFSVMEQKIIASQRDM